MNELLNMASKYNPAFCPNGCGHSYNGTERKKNLKKHLIYACGQSPQFQCRICSRKFVRKCTLKTHLQYVHKLILNSECTYII